MSNLVRDVVMVFDINGERKRLAFRRVPLATWQELKDRLGYTASSVIAAAGAGDVVALGALVWLTRRMYEPNLSWNSVRRQLDADELEVEWVDTLIDGESLAGDPADEAEPDPTPAGS